MEFFFCVYFYFYFLFFFVLWSFFDLSNLNLAQHVYSSPS